MRINHDKHSIGKKIKILREIRNYTQHYMSEKLGISQSDYSLIEQGTISLEINRLYEIAFILNITVGCILDLDHSRVFNFQDNISEQDNDTRKDAIRKVNFNPGLIDTEKKYFEEILKILKEENSYLREVINKMLSNEKRN
jgi:transcriptional regulator with XRE-family HTH domain